MMTKRYVLRSAAVASAVLCAGLGFLPPAQAAPEAQGAAAAVAWYCNEQSGYNYPTDYYEVRTKLCLGEQLGRVKPSLTFECKQKDWTGTWNSRECHATNMTFRLTAPDGTAYNGSMNDKTGNYFDIYGTTDAPCSVGTWKYEQVVTASFTGNYPASQDTSLSRDISISACS
ncbi:hypothetical protein [Streptomyces microflavus]|uniref:Secreted protein n=1 Tax=Streptomyces microflavus TaxID=1919 RepID=A0A7H8N0E0_STRMI|nr:hypothetical protein [Streptomyces microflavus]QKW47910.1 hypothetical protein HUT09_35940 [Streptomyces microflavus]